LKRKANIETSKFQALRPGAINTGFNWFQPAAPYRGDEQAAGAGNAAHAHQAHQAWVAQLREGAG